MTKGSSTPDDCPYMETYHKIKAALEKAGVKEVER